MNPLVSIIMGSTSDLPVMEQAAVILNDFEIPFEMLALSAHRTPDEVEHFTKSALDKGIKIIIAGAGMAAHLPGAIAAKATIPVIGVPIKATLDGVDAILSILQMPPGIPVATVGLDAAQNAALLAVQILALNDTRLEEKFVHFKEELKDKVIRANKELADIHKYPFKTN